jgi:hypothetical protein
VYSTAIFTLQEPLPVRAGDLLKVRIRCHDTGADYTVRWQTALERQGSTFASFDQSTFHAHLMTLKQLKARLPSHVPELKPEAEVARFILDAAHAKRSLGEIAQGIRERFTGRFESDAAALDHAAGLLHKLNG